MNFHYPQALWLAAVFLPLVSLFAYGAYVRRKALRNYWGQRELVDKAASPLMGRRLLTGTLASCAGFGLLAIALAQPYVEIGKAEFPTGTTDLMGIVDVSRSMAALDYKGQVPPEARAGKGTRLDMARYLLTAKIVPALGVNRLGLVTFAGEPFPLAFLTNDVPAADWVMRRAMVIGSAPGEGSALVKSFRLAFQLFDLDSPPGNRRIIVLFSDGGNDDGLNTLTPVMRELSQRGIELIVVGLGKTNPSAIPVSELNEFDRQKMQGREFYERDGEVVTTQIDENALRLFANRTKGTYVRVNQASDFDFSMLAQRIDMKFRPGKQELFFIPLAAGLVLIVLGWFCTTQFQLRLSPILDGIRNFRLHKVRKNGKGSAK